MGYTKKCWSCGKEPMVSKGNYYECSECGATWNSLPSLGSPDMARGSVSWQDSEGYRHRMPAGHPTKTAMRKAAKARALKEAT